MVHDVVSRISVFVLIFLPSKVLLCAVVWLEWRREFISGVFQVLHFQKFLKRYVLNRTRGDIDRVCGDEDFPSRVVQCVE